MSTPRRILIVLVCLAGSSLARAQDTVSTDAPTFETASAAIERQLQASTAELNTLRAQIADEKIPMSRKLNDLESELAEVRQKYEQTTRLLDSRTLDLSNLRQEIKSRVEESTYLATLLTEYERNFESRLHIAEMDRYAQPLETARLAAENSSLPEQEVIKAQAALLDVSLQRLDEILGGTRFDGSAVDPSGLVREGTFLLIGPVAIFSSRDGQIVGSVEQRIGSLEPTIVPYDNDTDTHAAVDAVAGKGSLIPLDPTMGNARKMEATEDSFWEHVKKGGPVMVPIFALAGAAFLVALYKWISLAFVKAPSQERVRSLLSAVATHDQRYALRLAQAIPGPAGRMLTAGVEHLGAPRELIEEVMYERVLATRLKLQRLLPFIAISASAAPLLGLLGTVTGIINTFKLITVFGTGDMKVISGGISEALITTEYGLKVAIPSLLIHAFLSRKARGIIDQMEEAGTAFVNQVGKTPFNPEEQDAKPIASARGTAPPQLGDKDPQSQPASSPEAQPSVNSQ